MMAFFSAGAAIARRLPPETAHRLVIRALAAGAAPAPAPGDDPILAVRLPRAGLSLANPIGLAAGFDKNAEAFAGLAAFGFGFVECGTVTPKPQVGNARPRLFRLPEDAAVINRMGFNNEGLDAFAARLSRRRAGGVVGANVGANKDSADRIADYVQGMGRLWADADYLTLNVSSPNTPGLRGLQDRAALEELLGRCGEAAEALTAVHGARGLFLKVAPDLDDAAIAAVAEAALAAPTLSGLIVSNTTVARPESLRNERRSEAGGLSGRPLFALSTQVLRAFAQCLNGRLDLIGAGGIASGTDALEKIRSGARAVQLYSALVYEGPGLVRRIKRELADRLQAEGFADVAAAVGVDLP
jgi:dihydroorotate dehydrogenase